MHTLANDTRPRLARGVRLQIDNSTGIGVLLYPEGVVELNETAQEILTRCNGRRRLREIIRELADEYDVNPDQLGSDVHETLADFQARKLIEFA